MKKSLKIMAALLLISSVVGSTQFVNSVVNAEQSVVYNDEVAGRRKMLEDEVEAAKSSLAAPGLHDLYTADSIARLEAALANAQNVLDNNLEDDYSVSYVDLQNARTNLVSTEVPESSSSESNSSESSSSESSSSESNSSESSSSESTSSGSGSTESSSSESGSTESSSSESDSTESSSSESGSSESGSTESSSSEVAAPSIEVGSQTVTAYVGQTLTEDIILSWATFKNAEGLTIGFEVVGDPIQVTALGNKLIEPGTHTIRFFVSNPAQQRSLNNVVAEKEITLNVLPESDNPLNPALPGDETKTPATEEESKAPTTPPLSNVVSPVSTTAKKTIDSSQRTAKQLPSTGETNNGMIIASAGVALISGAYIFRKKQLSK